MDSNQQLNSTQPQQDSNCLPVITPCKRPRTFIKKTLSEYESSSSSSQASNRSDTYIRAFKQESRRKSKLIEEQSQRLLTQSLKKGLLERVSNDQPSFVRRAKLSREVIYRQDDEEPQVVAADIVQSDQQENRYATKPSHQPTNRKLFTAKNIDLQAQFLSLTTASKYEVEKGQTKKAEGSQEDKENSIDCTNIWNLIIM